MKVLYTAHATSKAGRDGSVKVIGGDLDTKLSVPKGLGGNDAPGLNPEQLFAAGYAACFGSAVKFVAAKAKKNIEAPVVNSDVSIGANESGGFSLAVKLTLTIPGLSAEETKALADQAHQVCPYSNATRGNVPVEIVVG